MELLPTPSSLTNVAQVVLPYDPNTMSVPSANESGKSSLNPYIGLGIVCIAIVIIVFFVLRKRSRHHHRR